MAADDLVTWGARSWAAMILTKFPWNISHFQHSKGSPTEIMTTNAMIQPKNNYKQINCIIWLKRSSIHALMFSYFKARPRLHLGNPCWMVPEHLWSKTCVQGPNIAAASTTETLPLSSYFCQTQIRPLFHTTEYGTYEDFGARSRYLRQG